MDKETLIHVAKISHLELSQQEIKEFLPQLQEVIETCEKLKSIKTDEAPVFHPIEIAFQWREDKPEECLSREEALSLSKSKNGFFKGPKTI